MKEIDALLLILFVASCSIVSSPSSALTNADTWVAKAPMPTGRGFLGVAVVNNTIYAIGGSGPVGTNEAYDPATDTWTTKTAMPDPQQSFAIAVCQGKIFCFGGLSINVSDSNKVYDPETDSWETQASMPTARYGLQANVVDGKIYCMGGVKSLGYNKGVEELSVSEVYDPSTDTWSTKSSLPNPAVYVSAVVDNKIYLIGPGLTQIYDPATDTWSAGSPAPVDIPAGGGNGIAATAAATTGEFAPERVYVYDGSSLQVYDPQTDSWTQGTAPPTSRQYLGIAVVDDLLYFIGGFTYKPPGIYTDYTTNEQYTPLGYDKLPQATLSEPASDQLASDFPLTAIAAIATVLVMVAVVGITVYLKKVKR